MISPASPRSPSSHSWKSVFMRRNTSSKKLPGNGANGSALTLDTRTLSNGTGNSKSPITPKTVLTPASLLSGGDQRSSYNSSNTQSSDSNAGTPLRPHPTPNQQRPYSSYQQQPQSSDALSAGIPKQRIRTKSEKQTGRAALGRSHASPGVIQTANPSQSSFSPRSPPATSRQGAPLSPKSMGALPRFIRRVASAPNAKDLFSPKSRSASSTTKNGLLAPAESIPPVPVMPSNTSSEQGTEVGTDSLETLSSGSSRGRSTRPARANSSIPSQKRVSNGAAEGPGKAPFRRTYSSNSIKIRQVRKGFYI